MLIVKLNKTGSDKDASIFYEQESNLKVWGEQVAKVPDNKGFRIGLSGGAIVEASEKEFEEYQKKKK
jgi:hypothetical protein